MRDYKTVKGESDPVLVAFMAACLGYIVTGMSWSQIATYFGF